jgi:hypothetical protein
MPEKATQTGNVQKLGEGERADKPQQNGEKEGGEIDPFKRNL